MNEPLRIDDKIVIIIPEAISPKIYLVLLGLSRVIASITFTLFDLPVDNFIEVDAIMTDYIYKETIPTRINSLCQVVTLCDEVQLAHTTYCRRLTSDFECVKGYFIECNVDDLTGLEIQTNGWDRFPMYDKVAIKLLCHKINENLLYFSYNGDKNYVDLKYEDSDGSVDHTALDLVALTLKFKSNELRMIKIYTVANCIATYSRGYLSLDKYSDGCVLFDNNLLPK
jgi:hypothetical protein